MKARLSSLFISVLVFSGCVIRGGGGHGRSGDVTFSWSFAGRTCAQDPQVRSVAIRIPGEVLGNGGIYPCESNGYPGILLEDFAPGEYRFTVEALDSRNVALYTASGSFDVDGDIRVGVDLTPVGAASSYAYLMWSFPGNLSCGQVGAESVYVSIDGAAAVTYDCVDGAVAPGVTTPYLDPGLHTIELYATTADGFTLLDYVGRLQTFAGNPVAADVAMDWAVGGVTLEWFLFDGAAPRSCASAGVDAVTVNFYDQVEKRWIYENGDTLPCTDAIADWWLAPGRYTVSIIATGPGQRYESDLLTDVDVAAGVFPPQQDAVPIDVFRK